jgi:hypothetical protein
MGSRLRRGAEGRARDRLHHHLDLALAGGGVHPGAADGRRHRPHLQRIRGGRDGLDPGLGLRLADADADAVLAPASGYSEHHKENAFGRILEAGFDAILRGYDRTLLLPAFPAGDAAGLFRHAGSVWLLQTAPKGFFPQEDIGQLQVSTEARQDISFPAMQELQGRSRRCSRIRPMSPMSPRPSAAAAAAPAPSMRGGSSSSSSPRTSARPSEGACGSARDLAQVPGITAYMTPVQNLNIGARSSKSQYQLVVQGLDQGLMNEWARSCRRDDARRSTFIDVTTDLQNSALRRPWSSIATRPISSASAPTSCARRSIPASAPAGFDDLRHRRQLQCRRRVRPQAWLVARPARPDPGPLRQRQSGAAGRLRAGRAHGRAC